MLVCGLIRFLPSFNPYGIFTITLSLFVPTYRDLHIISFALLVPIYRDLHIIISAHLHINSRIFCTLFLSVKMKRILFTAVLADFSQQKAIFPKTNCETAKIKTAHHAEQTKTANKICFIFTDRKKVNKMRELMCKCADMIMG